MEKNTQTVPQKHSHQKRKILRRREVEARTGFARSTIYLKVSQGEFPKPIKLGARAVGWIEGEIEDWIDEKIDQSRRLNG